MQFSVLSSHFKHLLKLGFYIIKQQNQVGSLFISVCQSPSLTKPGMDRRVIFLPRFSTVANVPVLLPRLSHTTFTRARIYLIEFNVASANVHVQKLKTDMNHLRCDADLWISPSSRCVSRVQSCHSQWC